MDGETEAWTVVPHAPTEHTAVATGCRGCGFQWWYLGLAASQHVGSSWTRIEPMSPALAGEGDGTPLQYSCLANPMDGGAWWAAVHGVAVVSDSTFTFHFHAKEMATHSNVLAWRIPGMGEPGGLPSMRSHRVRHD